LGRCCLLQRGTDGRDVREEPMLAEACIAWMIIAAVVGVALSWGKAARAATCPNCGKHHRRAARYCSQCGAALSE
jgi:predicted amidophosphoribosyltransferase